MRALLKRPFVRFALPTAAAISFALFANAFTPVNTDLGWMLEFGRATLSGSFPRYNSLSFTDPNHSLFMPEWASCAAFFAIHRAWGGGGLIVAKWILVALAIVGVSTCVAHVSQNIAVRFVVVMLATHFLSNGFELIRSQLMTFCLLPWVVYAGLSGRRVALWACVPLMIIWVNTHGGNIAGFALLAAMCVGLQMEFRLGFTPRTISRWELASVALLSALASMATPYGFSSISQTLHHVRDPSRLLVREWLPLWRWAETTQAERRAVVALLVSIGIALVWVPKKSLRQWVFLGFGLLSSVSASRHLRIMPILVAPVLATALDRGIERLRSFQRERLEHFIAPISAAATVLFVCLWASRAEAALRFIDYPVPNPANAIAVMRQNGFCGNVWNDYDWGGFLIWAAPKSRVACDGRHGLAYSTEVILQNINFGAEADPLETVTGYGADLVLLPASHPSLRRLASRYTPLYCDDEACLLSSNPEHVAKAKQALMVPKELMHPSDFFQERTLPPPHHCIQ
jgi:hypothetical protein